ncbi:hypothetical protein FMUAM8_31190 [Nocardia cyriacigeorgica]|uniref:AraC effector-binding domain-containing protein n=3 Tax=Nocardia TaxID=1817 RepID=H6RAA6_NOCCG|nr:hypothetical protein FMUAM8_31190 [Nocardia cyriacigeorgica]CCF63714.1 conserved protein of unknown function, putative AraC domain [Nocardia cyriacigeorgica GUH-2]
MHYPVMVAEMEPETVLQLHRTVRADHAGDDIGNGMQTLFQLTADTGFSPAGPPSTTYHGDFAPGRTTEVDFCLPVAARRNSNLDQLTIRSTEAGLVVRTVHRGDYQTITHAYRALDDWLRVSRFRPIGPPTEVYLVAPDEAVAARDLVTEIRIPVVPTDLSVDVQSTVDQAVTVVREALIDEGFVVLAEIDVSATLRAETGRAVEDCSILGACHPTLAAHALEVDPPIGAHLLCNLVVRATDEGAIIEATDPRTQMNQPHSSDMDAIAMKLRAELAAAIATVADRSPRLHARASAPAAGPGQEQ